MDAAPFFFGPFLGGVLGGLVGGALVRPRPFYGPPFVPYYPRLFHLMDLDMNLILIGNVKS